MSVEQQLLELITFEPKLQKEFRSFAETYEPQRTDTVSFFSQKCNQYPHVSTRLKMIMPSFCAAINHSPEQFLQRILGVLNATLRPADTLKSPHSNYSQQRKIIELTPHYKNVDDDVHISKSNTAGWRKQCQARNGQQYAEQDSLAFEQEHSQGLCESKQQTLQKPRRQFRKSVTFENSLSPAQQKTIIQSTYNKPQNPDITAQVQMTQIQSRMNRSSLFVHNQLVRALDNEEQEQSLHSIKYTGKLQQRYAMVANNVSRIDAAVLSAKASVTCLQMVILQHRALLSKMCRACSLRKRSNALKFRQLCNRRVSIKFLEATTRRKILQIVSLAGQQRTLELDLQLQKIKEQFQVRQQYSLLENKYAALSQLKGQNISRINSNRIQKQYAELQDTIGTKAEVLCNQLHAFEKLVALQNTVQVKQNFIAYLLHQKETLVLLKQRIELQDKELLDSRGKLASMAQQLEEMTSENESKQQQIDMFVQENTSLKQQQVQAKQQKYSRSDSSLNDQKFMAQYMSEEPNNQGETGECCEQEIQSTGNTLALLKIIQIKPDELDTKFTVPAEPSPQIQSEIPVSGQDVQESYSSYYYSDSDRSSEHSESFSDAKQQQNDEQVQPEHNSGAVDSEKQTDDKNDSQQATEKQIADEEKSTQQQTPQPDVQKALLGIINVAANMSQIGQISTKVEEHLADAPADVVQNNADNVINPIPQNQTKDAAGETTQLAGQALDESSSYSYYDYYSEESQSD